MLASILLLALAYKGNRGNPVAYQNDYNTQVGGPFESSNSNARYALTQAIVESNTFTLNEKQARFSSPDVIKVGEKFFSIFTPGVSFIAVPFYLLGKSLGIPQLGSYLVTALFSLINLCLIYALARKMGSSFWASILGGFTFLFATNALGYSQTLTQHHFGVSIILAGLLVVTGKNTLLKNLIFGALAGAGLLIDVPVFILMVPLGIYLLSKNISYDKLQEKYRLTVRLTVLGLIIGIIPFLMLFGWYNHQTTGSYSTLAQSVGRTDAFKIVSEAEKANEEKNAGATVIDEGGIDLPFDTREQLQGFYILLLSNERAWIFYSPVVLIGVVGLYIAYKKKTKQTFVALIASLILLNIVLYSMFGDPWGGWSFGPRYLIPAAALLCIAIPTVIDRYKYNYFFLPLILILLGYSIFINSLGVLTTNAIPPKVEAIALNNPIPYTPEYNMNILQSNQSSSLIYNIFFAASIHAKVYAFSYILITFFIGLVLLNLSIFAKEEHKA